MGRNPQGFEQQGMTHQGVPKGGVSCCPGLEVLNQCGQALTFGDTVGTMPPSTVGTLCLWVRVVNEEHLGEKDRCWVLETAWGAGERGSD